MTGDDRAVCCGNVALGRHVDLVRQTGRHHHAYGQPAAGRERHQKTATERFNADASDGQSESSALNVVVTFAAPESLSHVLQFVALQSRSMVADLDHHLGAAGGDAYVDVA